MNRPSRRDLLRAAPLAAVPLLAGRAGAQRPGEPPAFPGMTVRMHEPRNLETPVAHLVGPDGKTTATEHFYIRSHFAQPTVDMKAWKLRVEGHVETPTEFTLDDLKKLTAVKKGLTLECAGNGRVFLTPAARGLQWGFGGVGTADWEGVALATVLEKAKPKQGAADVVLVGADKGAITADPASPGPIHYDRGIPLDKAVKPECVLAWGMNGQPLTQAHGFPLRAVIGRVVRHGGCEVADEDRRHRPAAPRVLADVSTTATSPAPATYRCSRRVTKIQPKAIITSHTEGQRVAGGNEVTVSGLAWSGESAAKAVEFSGDGGTTWVKVELNAKAEPFVWHPWSVKWTPKRTGPMKLLARCTDAAGNTQPDKRDPDRRTYMINHLIPVEVVVH
jgi:DMSO/TMAO reductase YedYZ molybdopterin-dependent catalytic subunit